MTTTSVKTFTDSIGVDCTKRWAKIANKATAMALIWQAEIRKETPVLTGTLRKSINVKAELLSLVGIELHATTQVPYFWCVNYGGTCPRGQSRVPRHFLEAGTKQAVPLMLAAIRSVK